MPATSRQKFAVGDRVENRESGKRGVVVYVFGDLTLKDVVAVNFDDRKDALAIHVDDVKKVPAKPKRGES
jgi:hypothetical protein